MNIGPFKFISPMGWGEINDDIYWRVTIIVIRPHSVSDWTQETHGLWAAFSFKPLAGFTYVDVCMLTINNVHLSVSFQCFECMT